MLVGNAGAKHGYIEPLFDGAISSVLNDREAELFEVYRARRGRPIFILCSRQPDQVASEEAEGAGLLLAAANKIVSVLSAGVF